MSKKVVIAGSVSLQEKLRFWMAYWQKKGYKVLDYPLEIPKSSFVEEYPEVYDTFFIHITQTSVLFVMNEDKNGIKGYVGAETFAEMGFAIVQNRLYGKNIQIQLLKMPEKQVAAYDEIQLWLALGWITLFTKNEL